MIDYETLYFSLGAAMIIRTTSKIISIMRAKSSQRVKDKAEFLKIIDNSIFTRKTCYVMALIIYILYLLSTILAWPLVLTWSIYGKVKRK
jgi:hypothetical protein